MSIKNKLLSHAATVLAVNDVDASISFYQNMLGFTLTFSQGTPTDYAVLRRDETVHIHLTKKAENMPMGNHASMYIFVYDVDKLFNEFQHQNVIPHETVADRDYGMRDFDVKDPDGHIITFGQGLNDD